MEKSIDTLVSKLNSISPFLAAMAMVLFMVVAYLSLHYFPYSGERRYSLPPGPRSWPIVGSLFTMLRHKHRNKWVLRLAGDKDIICIRLARTHVIVVNSPELAREFLKKHDACFASRPITMATEYLSRGWLSTAVVPMGEQWKKMRRVLASELLNPTSICRTAAARADEADHLVRYLYNNCMDSPHDPIDVRRSACYYTGNIARRLMFGERRLGKGGQYEGPGVEEIEHVKAAFTIMALIFSFCVSDYVPWLRWLDLHGHERAISRAIKVIDRYHDPIIDQKFESRRARKKPCTTHETESEDFNFLDCMISIKGVNGEPLLTKEEIRAQATEFLITIIDNPAIIVEWTLAEMLNHPHILKKAMDELDRVVGTDRLVQESDFPNLPYIKACARETLRLHPTVPFNVPHLSTQDVVVAGYFIPKGSHILLSRVGLGQSRKAWNDPLMYDPERHVTSGSSNPDLTEPDLRFVSFSTGRRGCIGSLLGTLMTYMLLARVLQAFEWSLPPGVSSVDLSWEEDTISMAKPLHACAKPRLAILKK